MKSYRPMRPASSNPQPAGGDRSNITMGASYRVLEPGPYTIDIIGARRFDGQKATMVELAAREKETGDLIELAKLMVHSVGGTGPRIRRDQAIIKRLAGAEDGATLESILHALNEGVTVDADIDVRFDDYNQMRVNVFDPERIYDVNEEG